MTVHALQKIAIPVHSEQSHRHSPGEYILGIGPQNGVFSDLGVKQHGHRALVSFDQDALARVMLHHIKQTAESVLQICSADYLHDERQKNYAVIKFP